VTARTSSARARRAALATRFAANSTKIGPKKATATKIVPYQ
jgi:hypothetical protein